MLHGVQVVRLVPHVRKKEKYKGVKQNDYKGIYRADCKGIFKKNW